MATDTTADLITRLKNRETIPDSGAAYSDNVLLEYLDQSLKGYIIPAIEATLEEHFVVTKDFQVPQIPAYSSANPPVNIPNALTIPGESTGLRLRDVYVVGNDGSFYNLPRLTPTQAAAQSFGSPWGPSIPTYNNQFIGGFFLQGNQVEIYPYGLASNKIFRFTYQRAPADLCLTTDAGQVVSIVGNVVTIDKVIPTWFGVDVNPTYPTYVSVVSHYAPYEYVVDPTIDQTVYTSPPVLNNVPLQSVAGNILTLPLGTGANIQVGDWICPQGSSVFAQNIPREMLPALVQKAAEMCIHAAGDAEGVKMANAEFQALLGNAIRMISPRVIGKPPKVLPTNSAFRANRGSNFGRW